MGNFIPPKTILGTIRVSHKDQVKKYYIGEANLAIEIIEDKQILNLWANSFHYEIHDKKEVLIGDISFEIMQPIKEGINSSEIVKIKFPDDIEKVENNWEELYYGHFYQFEHLKITNWQTSISPNSDGKLFAIEVKGYITDDIRETSDNHFVECTFKTELETKINSRFNWKYSLDNKNAKH